MTYVVTSGHVECLKSGRLVAPRSEVSNTEARQNSRLIERGALTERAESPKPKASKTAPKPDNKQAPKPESEKEDDK